MENTSFWNNRLSREQTLIGANFQVSMKRIKEPRWSHRIKCNTYSLLKRAYLLTLKFKYKASSFLPPFPPPYDDVKIYSKLLLLLLSVYR